MLRLKFQRQFAFERVDENCVVVRGPNPIIDYLGEGLEEQGVAK
jgi:hypothetical protein